MPRQLVIDKAAGMIGNPDPDIFWREVLPTFKPGAQKGLAWCGAFNLWALHEAGITTKKWKLGLGFLLTTPQAQRVSVPELGDTAYFDRPFQHHAIVERIEGAYLYTIDGNQGAPQTCKRKVRALVPVDAIQRAINTHLPPRSALKDDGIAGPKTQAAIVGYQASHGLSLSGEGDLPTITSLGLKPSAVFYSIESWLRAAG